MERLFFRERGEKERGSLFERKKIGVLACSAGAGASFAAVSAVKALSLCKDKKAAFIEVNGPPASAGRGRRRLLYDSLGMDKRFAGRDFRSLELITESSEKLKRLQNADEGINWVLTAPKDAESGRYLSEAQAMRLANNMPADLVVCDLSAAAAGYTELLRDMDLLVAVIDPLPSALIAASPLIRTLKNMEDRVAISYVVNKYNPGVRKRELETFLKIKKYCCIPFIDAKYLYAAEYGCKLPCGIKEVGEALKPFLEDLLREIG